MTDNKKQLVLILFVAGLALIGFALLLMNRPQSGPTVNAVPLSRVQVETGNIYLLRAGFAQREKSASRDFLYNMDSLETLDAAEAILSLDSAHRVRVLENSVITLESVKGLEADHIEIILKRGEIRIENYGREGELIIAKNGERISAENYNGSKLSAAAVIPPQSIDRSTPELELAGLNSDEISATLAQNRPQFFRCYTLSLQKNSNFKGDVSLSFTVEPSGRVSSAEVLSSQIDDKDFQNCLLETTRRLTFKGFQGSPLTTVFPLQFE